MRIGIVGAGFAGLRTAMLLEKAGIHVELFEARNRVGGRLQTVNEGNGAVYEAGGEWIDGDHHRILNLFAELGLEPTSPGEWPKRIVYGGKESSEALLWSDAMEDDIRVESAAREMCRDLREPPWKNTEVPELDRRTLGEFLAEHTQSDRGLWYVTAKYRSDEGDDPERIGLLGWLAGYMHYLDRDGDSTVMSAHRFPGGASSVCEQMLGALRCSSSFGTPLTRIRQDNGQVHLEFENGAATFDRVILTLPPPALERVCFDTALPVEKRCAIEACQMSRAIKIVWEFSEPWWKEFEWGGSMLCDGPVQQTWEGALGEAPILSSYICGDRACDWLSLGDPVNAGVYELAKMFPQAAKTFKRGWVHNWICDPYALGAFSHLAPGYVLEHMEHISTPEGRLHFAGEHTGTFTGFIEGALESAERVTQEILTLEGKV
jgi:monoamine oxidase